MYSQRPKVGPYGNPFAKSRAQHRQQPPRPEGANLPRFTNYVADYGGCGHYRVLWPEQVINGLGIATSSSNTGLVGDPNWYAHTTTVQIQRQASDDHRKFASFLYDLKQRSGFKLIYNIDDVPFKEYIPDYNMFKFAFDEDNIRQNIIDIMNMCDEVIVTCDHMRDIFKEVTGKQEITVIPNFPPKFWIGHQFNKIERFNIYDKHRRKPRILYSGSGAHFDVEGKTGGKDDLEMLNQFIIDTRHKYQWVFMGATSKALEPYAKTGEIEVHPWEPLLTFPYKIQQLEPSLMIAPLQDNDFNKCKSDIKFIEAAMLGIPVLLQDIKTYASAPAWCRFKDIAEFEYKIDEKLNFKNKKRYYKEVVDIQNFSQSRFLELPQNIGCFYEAYMTPYGHPGRKHLSVYNP